MNAHKHIKNAQSISIMHTSISRIHKSISRMQKNWFKLLYLLRKCNNCERLQKSSFSLYLNIPPRCIIQNKCNNMMAKLLSSIFKVSHLEKWGSFFRWFQKSRIFLSNSSDFRLILILIETWWQSEFVSDCIRIKRNWQNGPRRALIM